MVDEADSSLSFWSHVKCLHIISYTPCVLVWGDSFVKCSRVGCSLTCVKVCVCDCFAAGGTSSSWCPLKLGCQPTFPAKHWSWHGWPSYPDSCRQHGPSLCINPVLHRTHWDRRQSCEIIGRNESWISAARCQWTPAFCQRWWSDGLWPAAEHECRQWPTVGSGDRPAEVVCTTVLEQPACPASQFIFHHCNSTVAFIIIWSVVAKKRIYFDNIYSAKPVIHLFCLNLGCATVNRDLNQLSQCLGLVS